MSTVSLFALLLGSLDPDPKYLVTELKAPRHASYVAVAADALAEDCEALLTHRERLGHSVALVRASDLYREFGDGKPAAESLTQFALHASTRWKTRFLLLVGDTQAIPAQTLRSHYQTTRFANDEELGTDHLFAQGDLVVGRFPADSRTDLAAMISKTIDYEMRTAPGPWQRRISFITGEGGFGSFIDAFLEAQFTKIITDLIPAPYEIELAYAKPTSPYSPHPSRFNENAIRLMNEGSLFYVYVGHGKRSGCDTIEFTGQFHPILEVEHVPQIRIGAGRPIVVVIACNTGEFDAQTGDCLGEELMKSPTGPVAFIGGSRVTQPYGNALLGRTLVDTFLKAKPTAGEALFTAKAAVLKEDTSDLRKIADRVAGAIMGTDSLEPMRKDVVMHYNLLGDPGLVLRRPPETLSLEVTRTGNGVTVLGRAPFKEGRVHLSIECAREQFIRAPPKIPASGAEQLVKFAARYRLANDKALARGEVAVRDHRFELTFEWPTGGLPKGKHCVRAFGWNESESAIGSCELVLED